MQQRPHLESWSSLPHPCALALNWPYKGSKSERWLRLLPYFTLRLWWGKWTLRPLIYIYFVFFFPLCVTALIVLPLLDWNTPGCFSEHSSLLWLAQYWIPSVKWQWNKRNMTASFVRVKPEFPVVLVSPARRIWITKFKLYLPYFYSATHPVHPSFLSRKMLIGLASEDSCSRLNCWFLKLD